MYRIISAISHRLADSDIAIILLSVVAFTFSRIILMSSLNKHWKTAQLFDENCPKLLRINIKFTLTEEKN